MGFRPDWETAAWVMVGCSTYLVFTADTLAESFLAIGMVVLTGSHLFNKD